MSGAGRGGTRPEVRRLLLIQLKWLGDVLLTTPTIREARRAFPDAKIDYLVGEAALPALEGNPHLDELIVWRRGFGRDVRLLLRLLGRRYDAVVDMHSKPRSALQVAFAGGRERVGVRGRGPRNRVYTHLFPKEKAGIYIARQKMELLTALGVRLPARPDLSLELALTPEDRAWAAAMLERVGLSDGGAPVVALSAVTRSDHKQWGAEKWAAVGDAVVETGARVLLTSGPGELEQARAVAERMRHPAVWDYGRTTVRHLAAVYERCALWVGNDGGAKHLAAAVGTRTVTVNRWKIGQIWSDLSPGSGQIALERPPVLPCDFHCGDCTHFSCLEQLPATDVVQVVRDVLATLPSAHPRATAQGI